MDNFEQKATFSSVTDQKFCLGGDVFLSVSYFRGANNIHVRKWKSDVDILNPGKCIVYPTKIGIVLSREQLKLLKRIKRVQRHTILRYHKRFQTLQNALSALNAFNGPNDLNAFKRI